MSSICVPFCGAKSPINYTPASKARVAALLQCCHLVSTKWQHFGSLATSLAQGALIAGTFPIPCEKHESLFKQ